MPLRFRKRTIRAAVRDVIIAPFVLILVQIWANRLKLLLIAVLLPVCMWLAREPLANIVPSKQTIYTLLGVLAFISAAAIPLAIRDYFSHGGFETFWEHSDETIAVASEYAELLLAGDFELYYRHFSVVLQSECSLNQVLDSMAEIEADIGPGSAIESITEVEIPYAVYSAPNFDKSIDAIAEIRFAHQANRGSLLTLYLNSRESYRIALFRHVTCEVGDDDVSR